VPPIDLAPCAVDVEQAGRGGASGAVDCAGVQRSVLRGLTFSAN
jgi:hypothetical protein